MLSLYRKYRPQDFGDLLGQNHIKTILQNALKQGRVSHAYLFAGPRGTGKTTVARILAKAINCENKSNRPCGKCQSCKMIAKGRHLDIIEIDAASNRGIEEIRELREKVRFSPGHGKYKIFIVDEVHMLTEPAFNALLKTLEEPPVHAIFILVTTEAHKVPSTIVSRCQGLDFHRATREELIEGLQKVARGEKIKIEKEAIELLAKAAQGSFRDGISLLDQVANLTQGEITREKIVDILHLASEDLAKDYLSMLAQGKTVEALKLVRELEKKGISLDNFVSLVLEKLRLALNFKLGANEGEAETVDLPLELFEKWIEEFLKVQGEFRFAMEPILPLELATVKLATETRQSSFVIRNLSRNSTDVDRDEKRSTNIEPKVAQPYRETDIWPQFLDKIKPYNHSLYGLLKTTKILDKRGNSLLLGVEFKFHADKVLETKNKKKIEEILTSILKEETKIETKVIGPQDQALKENVLEVFGE